MARAATRLDESHRLTIGTRRVMYHLAALRVEMGEGRMFQFMEHRSTHDIERLFPATGKGTPGGSQA